MKPYFIWKGESTEDYKITINKLPDLIRPAERVNKIIIEGRNGFLTDSYGTYEELIKSCECTIEYTDNLDYICNWLTGSGEVIFSSESDKVYQATIINSIPFSKVTKFLSTFIIQFDCQPLKLSLSEKIKQLLTPSVIMNYGTIETEPVISIYGSGNVILSVNDNLIELMDIQDLVVIDSIIMDCYKDDSLLNNKMIGDFPTLKVGKNNISWTGNVSKVEVKYREKFI